MVQLSLLHTKRDRLSISQYLNNAMRMMRNWSKDRVRNKPFYEEPKVNGQTWQMAWDFLYKGKPVIKSTNIGSKEVFILAKDENKHLINLNLIKSQLSKVKLDFDCFMDSARAIKCISLDKAKWSDSKCSCSYFLKNYFCYHLIALAVNEGLLEIPLAYKNIAIGAKPKRGRKPKAVVGGKKRQPEDKA